MADKNPNDNKQSAFKGVDTLFDTTPPKKEEEKTAPVGQASQAPDAPKKEEAKAAPAVQTPQQPGVQKKEDELALAPTEALHGFPDHPYTVDENDNDMAKLVDSIQREGLLERIVVQRRKEGGFEILSGHRRHRACQMLGLKEVPVLIKHGLTQDQAILLMVDANLKRETILPLDEAKALKMQMDAMNRMGKRDPNGKLKRTDEAIAEKINKNRMYVQRKVKLLDLAPDLKEAVNDKTLSETPAYEIAFLPAAVQELFYDWMVMEDRAPTVAQAIAVRQHQQELVKTSGKWKEKDALLTEDQIDRIMNGERLAEIFPPPAPEKEEQAQAEKEAAGPQAPAASVAKEGDTAAPVGAAAIAGHVPAQGDGQARPGTAVDTKAIPFQTVNTPAPDAGRSNYNSAAPTLEPPAAQPAQQAGPAVDATKSYIRTEYLAELRKDNVILPKADIRQYAPGCYTNDEYVAAIKEALVKGQERNQNEKAAEVKPAPPINAVTTPTTQIINRAEAREAAEKAAKAPATPPPPPEPPKVDTKAPATPPAATTPPKVDTKAPATPPTATAPPKVDAKAPATPPTASEPSKVDTKAPAAPPTATAPPKVDAKAPTTPPPAPEPLKVDSKAPVTPPTTTTPPKVDTKTSGTPPTAIEPPKAEKTTVTALAKPDPPDSGTKALDDFLKNKPRPGKGKGPQDKLPRKIK